MNLPKYVPFNELKLSDALKYFLALHDFWVQKCKNSFFKKISVLSVVLFKSTSDLKPI